MAAFSRDGAGVTTLLYRAFPLAALGLAGFAAAMDGATATGGMLALLYVLAGVILLGTVFAAVYHAESIAHAIGEPLGTLVVTLAVTIIEVSLITSSMLGGQAGATLARDTVFSVIMIVCNGLVGLCLLLGGLRYREQEFKEPGANAYLSVLVALSGLTLVLPNHTTTLAGPVFSPAQLAFVSGMTIVLYLVFLFIQTVHHRDYFVREGAGIAQSDAHGPSDRRGTLASGAWLVVALLGVILLAKKLTAAAVNGLAALGAPAALAGVLLAMLVLLPEAGIALGAARRNDLMRSINAALGSSLATIGLTIPAVAVVTLLLHRQLVLGLESSDVVLLVLTFAVSFLSFGMGRTNVLMGFVHLVIFAAFLLLTLLP